MKKKEDSFDNIKQRDWKKLQGWEGKLLSQAGREILIKAVAQALPTYTMSCFKLPVTLFHDIEALIQRFFWGQRGDSRKVHWVRWEELCKPKEQGGMGFKDLSRFNDACSLNKLGDFYMINPHCFTGFLKRDFFQIVQS